jgi:hypothetical protein
MVFRKSAVHRGLRITKGNALCKKMHTTPRALLRYVRVRSVNWILRTAFDYAPALGVAEYSYFFTKKFRRAINYAPTTSLIPTTNLESTSCGSVS